MTNPHTIPAAELVASHITQAASGQYVLADDAKFFAESNWIEDKSVIRRSLMERAIIRRAVQALLAHRTNAQPSYVLTVHDGGSEVISRSRDADAIMGAIMATDEDVLWVRRYGAHGNERVGFLALIYGNDGWDVISDHTVALADVLQDTNDFAEAVAEVL